MGWGPQEAGSPRKAAPAPQRARHVSAHPAGPRALGWGRWSPQPPATDEEMGEAARSKLNLV